VFTSVCRLSACKQVTYAKSPRLNPTLSAWLHSNDHSALRTDWMPIAGRRQSGYGIAGIPRTMREITEEKMIALRRGRRNQSSGPVFSGYEMFYGYLYS
jgi:hypothetical protein